MVAHSFINALLLVFLFFVFSILVARINKSDQQKHLSQEDGAERGVEHGTKEVQEEGTYQLNSPLEDDIPDIPEDF